MQKSSPNEFSACQSLPIIHVLKRRRADLILVNEMVFGLLVATNEAFFIPRAQPQLRRHPYTVSKQR